MDKNESKLPERFEHKCFWVGPRTVWLMSLLTIHKTLRRFSLRLWQAGQWLGGWGKWSKGSWNPEYRQRGCRAFHLSSLLTARFRHNMWVSCMSRMGHAGRNPLGNCQWSYFPGDFWWPQVTLKNGSEAFALHDPKGACLKNEKLTMWDWKSFAEVLSQSF